jgi:hypothetical protein
LNRETARGAFTLNERGYNEAETHEDVLRYISEGRLDASIWLDLDRPFDLADIGAAFAAVEKRRLIKALVRLTR